MTDIPQDIQKILAELAGPAMLSYVTSIRTRYIDQIDDEHSGTGLLLTNQQGETYCLTANHVVTPSSRIPLDSRKVIQHNYVENLGRADDSGRIFLGDDAPIPPPFRLRRRYLQSAACDLAILGSCLNGYELPGISRKNYYPYSYLANARFHEIFDGDVFAVCGFPTVLATNLPAIRQTNYLPLLHLFTGSQGANCSYDEKRYTIEYSDTNTLPHGLSGAPVWLMRESLSPSARLDTNRLRACYKRGEPVKLTSWFAGILVSYDRSAGRIQAIRPEVCADFSTKAEQSKKDLKDKADDEIIEEQLGHWIERYGERCRGN